MVSSIPNEKEEVDSPLNFHLLPTLGTCACLSVFKNIFHTDTFFPPISSQISILEIYAE